MLVKRPILPFVIMNIDSAQWRSEMCTEGVQFCVGFPPPPKKILSETTFDLCRFLLVPTM